MIRAAAALAAGVALAGPAPTTLTRVGPAPGTVAGAASRSGGRYALVTDDTPYLYPSLGADPTTTAKPALQQGESVAVSVGGGTVVLGSEGTSSPVYRTAWPGSGFTAEGSLALTSGPTATKATGGRIDHGERPGTGVPGRRPRAGLAGHGHRRRGPA